MHVALALALRCSSDSHCNLEIIYVTTPGSLSYVEEIIYVTTPGSLSYVEGRFVIDAGHCCC
jgi:hypothetical protein